MRTSRFAAVGSALLLLAATTAVAQPTVGFNLTWGTGCWQDNPTTLKTFSCDSNEGSATLAASFVVDRRTYSTNLQARIDLQSDSAQLPDWWQLGSPAGCRSGSLSVSYDFNTAPGGCRIFWPGQAQVTCYWVTTAIPGPYGPVTAPNRARLTLDMRAIPQGTLIPLVAGLEYYAFKVTLDFARTVGPGACAGCTTPVTIVLNQLLPGPYQLSAPLANACLRWQADGVTPCSATPARNSTWGQVKGLYR